MTTLVLDKDKLINNIKITKKLAGSSKIIAVIKGNAYGHGLLEFASLLVEQGVGTLAVVEHSDAIDLRNAGFTCEIINLSPVYAKPEIEEALKNDIVLTITTARCGEITNEVALASGIYAKAHLCIDTGLGRHGFPAEDVNSIEHLIKSMSMVQITGIYSHFSTAAYKKDTIWLIWRILTNSLSFLPSFATSLPNMALKLVADISQQQVHFSVIRKHDLMLYVLVRLCSDEFPSHRITVINQRGSLRHQ